MLRVQNLSNEVLEFSHEYAVSFDAFGISDCIKNFLSISIFPGVLLGTFSFLSSEISLFFMLISLLVIRSTSVGIYELSLICIAVVETGVRIDQLYFVITIYLNFIEHNSTNGAT